MSTDKVDAREAWASAGDALLWSMAAVICNQSSSIAERAEALNCAARHLRTTPEGYVLLPVKPTRAMLVPFDDCPEDELTLAYQAMLIVAAAQVGK